KQHAPQRPVSFYDRGTFHNLHPALRDGPSRIAMVPQQDASHPERIGGPCSDDLGTRWNLTNQLRVVHVVCDGSDGKNGGHPAASGQVLNKLQTALDPAATNRRKHVGEKQDATRTIRPSVLLSLHIQTASAPLFDAAPSGMEAPGCCHWRSPSDGTRIPRR